METFWQDVRFAGRTLLKSPGLTTVALLCIALGIGANTTIFSVVNAILLRPFPFAHPEQIVAVHETQVKNDINRGSLSYQDYLDVVRENTVFSDVAAYEWRSLTLGGTEEPERVEGAMVSSALFPLLGVAPVLGRGIREDEDAPGAPAVVLLSENLWRKRFQNDPGVIGKVISVNDAPHTIVGVMPARFNFPEHQQAWVALAPIARAEPRSDRSTQVLARLKPGASIKNASNEMAVIAKRLEERYPLSNSGWSATVLPLREEMVGKDTKLIVLTMMGAVAFVLLIACANVANLLLARATGRQREIAVRAALGAGRGRIIRQLLTESVLIGLAAAPLGVLLGLWGIDLIEAGIPPSEAVPFWMRFTIDGPVLAFTLTIAVGTGLLFGLAPALQATKSDLHEALKDGGRGSGGGGRRSRLRSTLVVAEVALSLVLLVGASLFVRSFLNVQVASGGFATENVLTMRVYLPGARYDSVRAKTRQVEDLVRRLEALPGVDAATASNLIPLSGGGGSGSILLEGRDIPRGEEPVVYFSGVTSHFFKTLGVPVQSGRSFTDQEGGDSSAVAVVNAAFAKKFWPEGEAVGHRFRLLDDTTAGGHWITVIGTVADFRNDNLDTDAIEPAAYLPYPYLPVRNNGLTIRTGLDPTQVTALARREIRASDPALPVFEIASMEEVRRTGFWHYRLFSWMFSIFGGAALFLASIGVYGVLSYAVGQRNREIGVRLALGAQGADVVRLIVKQGVVLAGIGVALGLLGAFAVTRVVGAILYNVSATDPLSFIVVSCLLAGVAFLASYLPARRATLVDPIVTLRAE